MPSGRACTASPFELAAAASIASANRPSVAQVASRGAATVVAKYPVTPWVVRNLPRRGSSEGKARITVEPGSAVHMNIEEAGRQRGVAEIDQRSVDGSGLPGE